jgi:hypothetical protein
MDLEADCETPGRNARHDFRHDLKTICVHLRPSAAQCICVICVYLRRETSAFISG